MILGIGAVYFAGVNYISVMRQWASTAGSILLLSADLLIRAL